MQGDSHDPREHNSCGGPLAGVTVLALEHFIAGPYGSMLLADFGATVIKVEPPTGDAYRRSAPILTNEHGSTTPSFMRVNRNKESVVLDLMTPEDQVRFLEMVGRADVVWENLAPGVLDRLGIGWDALQTANPRLVLASLSGFGKHVLPGPRSHLPAFDIVAQALSGHMLQVGEEGQRPLYLGAPFADIAAGMLAALGVVLALRDVDRCGVGQRVDIAMLDTMIALNEQAIGYAASTGLAPPRGQSPTSAPFSAYRCRDGWIAIGVSSDEIFARLCKVICRTDLLDTEAFATGIRRVQHIDELTAAIEAWSGERDVEVALVALADGKVPAGPVQGVLDLFADTHVRARRMIVEVEDPVGGPLQVAGNPLKLEHHLDLPLRPAPQLGANQSRVVVPHDEEPTGA